LHWRPAVARPRLAPLRPHGLKHTGVALLALAGVDPSEIARRAGQASVAFTYDRYGHLLPKSISKRRSNSRQSVRPPAFLSHEDVSGSNTFIQVGTTEDDVRHGGKSVLS
jgi:integrase